VATEIGTAAWKKDVGVKGPGGPVGPGTATAQQLPGWGQGHGGGEKVQEERAQGAQPLMLCQGADITRLASRRPRAAAAGSRLTPTALALLAMSRGCFHLKLLLALAFVAGACVRTLLDAALDAAAVALCGGACPPPPRLEACPWREAVPPQAPQEEEDAAATAAVCAPILI